jgi:5-hydroxyisourate hydrolase
MAQGMNRISTHVLDTARGKPASGVPVKLEQRQAPDRWRVIASGRTDADGRCAQLWPESAALPEGLYRLTFETSVYYATQRIDGLFPIVEISFSVRSGETNFHIPLLLSANGYTTYRGS